MLTRWVNLVSGVPTVSNFSTTQGQGSPLCLDTTTGAVYYLTAAGVVQQANQTINGNVLTIRGSTPYFARTLMYALVDGTDYGFSEATLGLTHPGATPYPDALLYGFGAEGFYSSLSVVGNYDFYIYDAVASVYRLYTDQTGAVKLGGSDAKTLPGLAIATNGALTIPEVAAASVATPAATHQTLFIDTADHKLKRKDSAGTVTIIA